MSEQYTERDTERARAAERGVGSAGMPTQNLGELPPTYAGPGSAAYPAPRNNNLPALALIGVGLVMIVAQLSRGALEIEGGMILLTIASCFLFFAFWKRIFGLLIPGSILAGLSVGVTFADMTDGVSVLWGLSLGFMAILLLGRSLFGMRSSWPAIPGVILFAVGTMVAISNAPGFLAAGLVWLPLALIGAGLFLGWGRGRG
jgi:uncharacterized membrane protein